MHFSFCSFLIRFKLRNFFQIFSVFAIFPISFSSELNHYTRTHTHTISNSLTQFLQQITLQVREKCKTILKGAISFQDISPQYNLYFLQIYICFRNVSNLITADSYCFRNVSNLKDFTE